MDHTTDHPAITYDEQGQARTFSGEGVNVFAMAVIASGLRLYAKTGIKPNRHYTPTAMMQAARRYLGEDATKGIKAKDYLGMAEELSARVQTEKARLSK